MLVTVPGTSIMAERYEGDTARQVVALHGWGRNRHDWAGVLAGFNALALDLPGFGATQAPDVPWTTSDYAEALLPALADGPPPVLVGHSFGGRIAVQLAAMAPQRVSGLVLTGVPLLRSGGGSGPKPSYRVARWLHARGLLSEESMESVRQRHGSADYRAAQGVMRGILVRAVNEDYTAPLAQIAAAGIPVRMVWGERDTAAPVASAVSVAQLMGDQAKLEVVAGSAHLLDDKLVGSLRTAIEELM